MKAVATAIADVQLLEPRVFDDSRGFFFESYNERVLAGFGILGPFVQDNQSFSHKNVVRGLHYQIEQPQGKLIRCLSGEIFDVAVDIRRSSPTFGRHLAVVLSAENWKQLYVPVGFAHGYCTLDPDSEVIYKVTAYYDPESERGVAWDDPDIGIAWPLDPKSAVLTQRDRALPRLAELPDFFPYSQFPD